MVKSLAATGPFLCSGGADDLIHLYDLKHGKDLGFLVNPGVGAITAMSFYTPVGAFRPTHLLAGCHDGSVTVWSVADGWQCMKTLRGHRGEVYSVAVHGTGVLALSTSHDGTLQLWDIDDRVINASRSFPKTGAPHSKNNDLMSGDKNDDEEVVDVSNVLTSLKFAPQGDILAVGFANGHIKLLSVRDASTY